MKTSPLLFNGFSIHSLALERRVCCLSSLSYKQLFFPRMLWAFLTDFTITTTTCNDLNYLKCIQRRDHHQFLQIEISPSESAIFIMKYMRRNQLLATLSFACNQAIANKQTPTTIASWLSSSATAYVGIRSLREFNYVDRSLIDGLAVSYWFGLFLAFAIAKKLNLIAGSSRSTRPINQVQIVK